MVKNSKIYFLKIKYTTGKGWNLKYHDIELFEIDGKYHTLKRQGYYTPNLSNFNSAIGTKTRLPRNIVEVKKTEVTK